MIPGYPIPGRGIKCGTHRVQPVVADFTADVTAGTIPLAVSFTSTSSGNPVPTSYAWDFGDGTTSRYRTRCTLKTTGQVQCDPDRYRSV